MVRMPPDSFTASRWRACDVFTFVPWRTPSIVAAAPGLRGCAVGWCPGRSLYVRPRDGAVAVMFWRGGEHQWCHMTAAEFAAVFSEVDRAA